MVRRLRKLFPYLKKSMVLNRKASHLMSVDDGSNDKTSIDQGFMLDINGNISDLSGVNWPKRAVVTAGMPYGNKALHFGHIGGVFIPADVYARFLRDRIGSKNVRFVSGTDCYGSPINEGYRKAVESEGFCGTIKDYVIRNHEKQKETLEAFEVSLDIFEGSGIGHSAEVHQDVTNAFITGLFEADTLSLDETLQFFDAEANMFLNGRQVQGRCPVQGCKSEHGYADECDLGHQYLPEDLINPVSTVTGTKPELRPVKNWYFDLPDFKDFLQSRTEEMRADKRIRPVATKAVSEFLSAPVIFVKQEFKEPYTKISKSLPPHTLRETPDKPSFELEFDDFAARDVAKAMLHDAGINYRTSKALVPFRITGSIEWGVKAPVLDGVEGLTVWCWPESLWAPISFTIAYNDSIGLAKDSWLDFWCSDDACVYQFIGQDNLYFYGVAQPALWEALGNRGVFGATDDARLRQTVLIANHHLLFGKNKASSSGSVKPPSGEDLLEHYTAEQLRAHFIALGLDQRSVGFKPKPFDPSLDDEKRNDPRVADPALKEAALLNNVFNRLARSCFYESAKSFNGYMPVGKVTEDVVIEAKRVLVEYDKLMELAELHSVIQLADEFIRYSNKYWTSAITKATEEEKEGRDSAGCLRRQALVDSYYLLRVCTLIMHPIAPSGCELICKHMKVDPNDLFSWDKPFLDNSEIVSDEARNAKESEILELPPKFDFFPKHPSQFK